MEPHRRSPPTPPLLSPNSPPKYPVNSIPQKQGAVLFLDENGNPVRIDSTWYSSHYSALEIDFDAFELIGQNRSIDDADAVDVATINDIDTATINIFPFLDQVHSNIAAGTEEPISFAFLFTFATPVNQSTVDIDDFNISLVDSSGSSTRLDSNNDNITFTFTDYSTGGETSSTLRYDLVDTAATNITFNSDSTVITMSFPLEDDMLYYGFDIEDQLAVALDPANDIASATGIALGSGSDPLAYIVQAQMPLLTEFLFVDPTTDIASPDDASVNQYSTFAYSQGIDSSANFAEYYGFRLRYGFSEPIAAVQGRSDTIDYFAPDDGYYLEGAGTDLLAYQKYEPFGAGSADLPTSGSVYDTFFTDGSLVHPDLNDPDANTTWDHLVYLSDDEAQFESDTADHNFTIVASESKTYMSGSDITAYGASLPILLGGYDPSGGTVYTPTTKLEANFFLDAYGNPARVALDWLYGTGVEANSTLAITYDRSKPSLLSAQALETIDTDADGNADTFDGSFGTFSDEVTFEFALTFDREMDQPSLESGILWDVAISSSYALDTPAQSVSAGTPDGTNYIYTFTYSVDEGLYAAGGDYAITFDTSETVTDTKGNELDLALANTTLESTLCLAGTCQFLNNPVTLEAFTVDPGGVVVIGQDSTSAAAFNVTFTFSEPVTLNTTANANFFFDLIYTELERGTAIESATVLEETLQSLDPVAASEDVSGYYTEYQLSVSDSDNEHWAIDRYEDEIGVASVVSIFFEDDKFSSIGSLAAITFHSNFESADGSLITIPPSVQSGTRSEGEDDPTAGATAMQYLISNIMPALDTATPIAADLANSQNDNLDHFDSDTPVARHVEFSFNDTLLQAYGTSVGMLMLYRTEDDQFTHTDASTAPYYGADGGVIISGAELNANNIGHHVCPPFSDRIHGPRAGSPSPNAPISYNPNRLKIHYLAIPYYPNNLEPIDEAGISALSPISVDFSTSADYLSDTEPCVRSTFYNQGVGQYGYIVDTDREEEMMLIANAMLQDQDGYNLDDARLPLDQHDNVYFDLYTRDFYNDSWQKDLTITLAQVLADLKDNIGAGTKHDITGIDISFGSVGDSADDTIFASRFINTINARFLNNVFLDDLTAGDIKGYDLTINDYMDNEITPIFYDHLAAGIGSPNIDVVDTSIYDTNMNPYLHDAYASPEDTSAAALAPINQNRLVLSVGVHPSSILVDVGTSGAFNPFATDPAQLLEMDGAFYDLHYGGNSDSNTKPAFDYTSRHLAYVNFDLVYELTRDPDTGAITGYSLEEIVSPFTLLQAELFSSSTLGEMQTNGEVYSAVAASIADNLFRYNFLGNSESSQVGHYLPVGAYCRISDTSSSSSACYNDFAQMLLPDPSDTGTHQRNQISDHYLHRHLLRLDPATYSPIETTETDYDLLSDFLYLSSANIYGTDANLNAGNAGHVIDERDYSTIIYNSFSRDYGLNYSHSNLSFSTTRNMDTDYISDTSDHSDAGANFEQSFFGLSPFAESPNARADQIFPNAFFLGTQTPYDYYFQLIVKPYQYSGYTIDIKADLAAADDLNLISSQIFGTDGRQSNGSSNGNGSTDIFSASSGYFLHHRASYGIPYSSGSIVSTSSMAGPRTDLNRYYYDTATTSDHKGEPDNTSFSHILASAPEHFRAQMRFTNIGRNSDHGVYVLSGYPSLFSGRLPGMSLETSGTDGINRYNLHSEYQHDFIDSLMPATASYLQIGYYTIYNYQGGAKGDITLSDLNSYGFGATGNARFPFVLPSYSSDVIVSHVDTFDQSVYDGGRVLTPADDYDFDRGQTLARKLGFFLSEGVIFQSTDSNLENDQRHASFINIFLPTAPDTPVGAVGRVVADYNSPLVDNYYPLVQASETLYTADSAYPTLVVGYRNAHADGRSAMGFYHRNNNSEETPGHLAYGCYNECAFDFGYYDRDNNVPTTFQDMTSNSGAIYHHIPLDKIFPAGYSYQLGFINREELFMYDPAVGNGDNDAAPQINRFSEAGVGSFGYATQYNRLNRRSMIEIHQRTASHFLGDHLARFQGTPSAGVHVSNDIDNPYKHTPANQGATGTNYGSYGDGHYDLTTEADASANSSTWKHRTYSGTLRGYVLEMRMNPIYTSPVYKITDTSGDTGDVTNGILLNAGSDFQDDSSTAGR